MRNQFKYALYTRRGLRVGIFVGIVGLNLVLAVVGLLGFAAQVTAITVSSLAFCGLYIGCLVCDAEHLRQLYSAPAAYCNLLAPVAAWKQLLPRVLSITVLDILYLVLGVAGIAVQALLLDRPDAIESDSSPSYAVWLLALILVGYLLAVCAIFFAAALCRSLFSSRRGNVLLGIVITVLVMVVMGYLNIILAPFGEVSRWGASLNINFVPGSLGSYLYLVLSLVKAGLVFYAAAYLTERKINL